MINVRFYLNSENGRRTGLGGEVLPKPDYLTHWECPCAPRAGELVQLKGQEWRRVIQVSWKGPCMAIVFVSDPEKK